MTTTIHWRTPNLTVIDSRGLPIRQVTYLRKVVNGTLETLITRQRHDAAGRLLEQSDPRLFGVVSNLATVYRLSGEPLKVDSVDAGWRLSLPGLAGEKLQRWDQRGSHWRTTYDPQLRPLAIEENGQPNVETFMYADASGDPGCNLRGQMIKQTDSSGGLELSSFSLQGQSLRETRTIADKVFVGSRTWSPLGAMLTQTDAGNHQQQLRYDITGQLKKAQLRIKPEGVWLPILEDAQYNAAGQIIEQRAGNKVVSSWIYDAVDGRLKHLKAGVPETALRQNFEYVHDRVGNVLRIDDHTFQTRFFANQHMDGHREFTYDSLYRLISATGHDAPPTSDLPGRPLPSDPNNHLNYHQTYEYDLGGNLNKLIHGRAVGGYTQEMLIDPSSNRGVRGKEGDPVPDFPALFDRHGNLRALQSGIDLQWSSRDQLASVTLVKREDGPDDEETYRYSQGVRVYKCHQWHTPSTSHFHEVMYLPGLEIRKRDNGEELHVITLPSGFGSVRCLHWVSEKPDGIDADQLRYSLADPLGSSLMELDQHASLISHEGYYPFGGTAWLTADSALEVSYKTIRYSGKEMDVSGLYYYGLRYYAPWLWRWVNPDPLGAVDGLNLYRMVGNNPMNFVDDTGGIKTQAPQPPQQTTISIGSASPSRTSSIAGSTMSLSGPELVDNPRENPPGTLPPEPKPEGSLSKRAALWVVNSKVGLAWFPVATSSPASSWIIPTTITFIGQIVIASTLFNPSWSAANTWYAETNGTMPDSSITQDVQRVFSSINLTVTLATALVGGTLAPIVGGYVDELRGTKEKGENKAKAAEMGTNINRLIAEQRLLENVTKKAQDSLHEQVLEVESLIGITWNTMEMLEKIQKLRPGIDSARSASSRRNSVFSLNSGNGLFRRTQSSRIPVRPNQRPNQTAPV
jgi:insecticidal toxin complex protein TccC